MHFLYWNEEREWVPECASRGSHLAPYRKTLEFLGFLEGRLWRTGAGTLEPWWQLQNLTVSRKPCKNQWNQGFLAAEGLRLPALPSAAEPVGTLVTAAGSYG